MSFRYTGTQLYSGTIASNPDTFFTSSNSASYVGGIIYVTGSANIFTSHGDAIAATDLNAKEFYPIEVKRITGGASAKIYVLSKSG